LKTGTKLSFETSKTPYPLRQSQIPKEWKLYSWNTQFTIFFLSLVGEGDDFEVLVDVSQKNVFRKLAFEAGFLCLGVRPH
jgi:hypothetical protein